MIQEESLRGTLKQILCYSDLAIDKDSLILLIQLERLFEFAMLDRLLIKHALGKSLSAVPTKPFQKMHWLNVHKNQVHQLIFSYFDTIIIAL